VFKVHFSEYTRESITKEFEITQELLDEWKVTEEQIRAFIEDPETVDDDIHDILREMFCDIDYKIYAEDSNFDDEDWEIVE